MDRLGKICKIATRLLILRSLLYTVVGNDSNSGQNADNNNDNQEFDNRKTILFF
ncbi:hypothetical protein D3C85_1506110 [compost metagenome]